MLHHYRAALAFRRMHPTLVTGDMTVLATEGEVARFTRAGDEAIFCAFNLSDQAAHCSLPDGTWAVLGENLGGSVPDGASVMLAPWGVCLLKQT